MLPRASHRLRWGHTRCLHVGSYICQDIDHTCCPVLCRFARRLRLGVIHAACTLVHTFVKTLIIHAAPPFASPNVGVIRAACTLVHTFVKTLIIHAAPCFASPKVGVICAACMLVHTFVKTLIIHAAPRFASPKAGVIRAACTLVHTFVKTLIIHAAPCFAGSHAALGWGSYALPARWFIHLSRR